MSSVCLISTGQPTTNPRLVKEADALVEAGYEVQVVCTAWSSWADAYDPQLMESRKWAISYAGGKVKKNDVAFVATRLRHGAAMRAPGVLYDFSGVRHAAISRTAPDLIRRSSDIKADLYIAHNLGALPAAVIAAQKNRAIAGFDAEDFHSAMTFETPKRTALIERIEAEYLPQCKHLTAASPGIAEHYARKYRLHADPVTILNVFPLSYRPESFRTEPNPHLELVWSSQTLGTGRGLFPVLEALSLIRDLPVRFHLLGYCPPAFKSKMLGLISRLNLRPENIVLHDPIPENRVIKFLSQFDIGMASEEGGILNKEIALANKVFAYLLAGCVVLASARESQVRMARECEGAMKVYKDTDPSDLANTIESHCQNRQALQAARTKAWDLGTSRFNWDVEKEVFLRTVKDTLTQ